MRGLSRRSRAFSAARRLVTITGFRGTDGVTAIGAGGRTIRLGRCFSQLARNRARSFAFGERTTRRRTSGVGVDVETPRLIRAPRGWNPRTRTAARAAALPMMTWIGCRLFSRPSGAFRVIRARFRRQTRPIVIARSFATGV